MAERIQSLIKDLPPFPIEERGFYHTLMSLIISQRIRFSRGRKMRETIYKLLGEFSLDRIMSLSENQRKTINLHDQKWEIIKSVDEWFRLSSDREKLTDIKGIGPWTIACASIMVGDYSVGFISGDLAVRKEVSRLLERPLMKPKEVEALFAHLSKEEGGRIFSIVWNKTRVY